MKTQYETIIIGGGVAGIACLQELKKHNRDVLLVTKKLGGRLCTSKDGTVNYGAYILPETDTMIQELVDLTERMHLRHISCKCISRTSASKQTPTNLSERKRACPK